MSAGHKIKVYAKSTNVAAVAGDQIEGINDASMQELSELLDATTFKSAGIAAWKKRIAGLHDGSMSLSGDFEAADAPQVLLRTSRRNGTEVYLTFVIDPTAAAGSQGIRVPCLVESSEASGSVDGKAETSISLQFNGAPTDV